MYTRTEAQGADMFTKSFNELPKWLQAIRLIGISKPGGRLCMSPEPGPRPETLENKKIANQKRASDGAADP